LRTAPYALIEGVCITRADSTLTTAHDVGTQSFRIGVRTTSAYALYLTARSPQLKS
jgi:hypothetical protein